MMAHDDDMIFDITRARERETEVLKIFFVSAREDIACICDW